MNLVDPVQVWENDLPMVDDAGQIHYYSYVAYRNAEDCAGYYGYGNTRNEAAQDFLQQEANQICCNCTDPCSSDDERYANDCILIEPNLSAWLRRWMEEDDTSHRVWRELNGPLAFKP